MVAAIRARPSVAGNGGSLWPPARRRRSSQLPRLGGGLAVDAWGRRARIRKTPSVVGFSLLGRRGRRRVGALADRLAAAMGQFEPS